MQDGSGTLRLIAEEEQYPRRTPVGVYDSTILCDSCEPIFGEWDNYAQELLSREPKDATLVLDGAKVVGYEVLEYRYDLLKLFFISLLWRASVSGQEFYRKVKLGPYEPAAKRLLECRHPGSAQQFAVTLAKFDDRLAEGILDPHPEKWDGINYYRFYLGGYVAYVKADRRSAPKPHSDFLLTPERPLRIIRRRLEGSSELSLMHKIAAAAQKRLSKQDRE
jgi:hypothetical protein